MTAIDSRSDEAANETLRVPASFSKVRGQPIKQFGMFGRSPCTPKSSGVFTIPIPKNCCQNRFTTTAG